MRRTTLWVLCLAAVFLAGELFAQAKALKVGAVPGKNVTVPITMSSDEDVQGFVVGVAFDAAKITATDIDVGAGVTGAELVVGEVLAGGATLGVVMDFQEPWDGQTIDAGNDVEIATLVLEAQALVLCGETETVPLTLTDGLNDPPLRNILVVGGMSVSTDEGLVLEAGSVEVPGTCDTVKVVSATGAGGAETVAVTIAVDNGQPVEGFVLSIGHESGVELTDIALGAKAAGAEFFVPKKYPTGGTLGVVFDFDPPYDGQTLAPGDGNAIAVFTYKHPAFDCPAGQTTTETFDISFVDGVFGSPLLSNVLVEGGMSVTPDKVDGTVTFTCKTVEVPAGIAYYIGQSCGEPEFDPVCCAVGSAGAEAKVSLFYTSERDPIQGMSMALTFPTALQVVDLDPNGQGIVSDKHIDGTLTEGINAEFVSFNADNTTGELIVGILVDSTPPIPLNHMYPPRALPGKVMNIFFMIPRDAACDTSYPLTFVNPVYGAGDVPIYNRASVFNASVPVTLVHGCLTVGGVAAFIRGDCNTDQWVDIADPAATMSFLFLGVFDPACMDACDSNDDGVVDLADVASTLRFLFKLGPILPDPGPYPPGGDDPTEDIYGLDLGCEAGDPCN